MGSEVLPSLSTVLIFLWCSGGDAEDGAIGSLGEEENMPVGTVGSGLSSSSSTYSCGAGYCCLVEGNDVTPGRVRGSGVSCTRIQWTPIGLV